MLWKALKKDLGEHLVRCFSPYTPLTTFQTVVLYLTPQVFLSIILKSDGIQLELWMVINILLKFNAQ